MKNFIKGLIGIILILLAIATIFYWEVYGRESLLYENIVVLTKDVNKNEVVTSDMVAYQKREGTTLIDKVILDSSLIIGKAANCYIPSGVQLVEKYFESPNLVPDEDQYIFKIPLEWLKAFPSSLRRGDIIFFYEVEQNAAAQITNEQTIDDLNATENEIVIHHAEAIEKKPITSATVAYVKDGANREVITLSDEERYNGSSKISEIEIITDLETVGQLKESIKNGNIFIIMYQ